MQLANRRHEALLDYWDSLSPSQRAEKRAVFWMSHPLIRRRINASVSGDPDCWPLEWLGDKLATLLPFDRAAVIGCGTGALERDLARKEMALQIVGVDRSPGSLALAIEQARDAKLEHRVRYVCGDADEFLDAERELDAVFFHASLHHFADVPGILDRVHDALRPGGTLYLDEYVGPSMHQWGPLRLLVPNLAYWLLPRRVRRPRLIRAPRNPDDPSEAIASATILPAVEERFTVRHRRDYGGNLIALLWPNLDTRRGDATGRAIRRLARFEDLLLRYGRPFGVRSHHAVVVAGRTG